VVVVGEVAVEVEVEVVGAVVAVAAGASDLVVAVASAAVVTVAADTEVGDTEAVAGDIRWVRGVPRRASVAATKDRIAVSSSTDRTVVIRDRSPAIAKGDASSRKIAARITGNTSVGMAGESYGPQATRSGSTMDITTATADG
jgi:hypothetical protein